MHVPMSLLDSCGRGRCTRTWRLSELCTTLMYFSLACQLQLSRTSDHRLMLIALTVLSAFSALRMYAITGRNLRTSGVALALGLITPILNAVSPYVSSRGPQILSHVHAQYYSSTLVLEAAPPPFRGCGQQSRLDSTIYDTALSVQILSECTVCHTC